MKLNLGDIISTSTLDWPGKVAMVVFMQGCPLGCPYCSNARFIGVPDGTGAEDTGSVNAKVSKASEFIDGVVFSGGEPFMQPEALGEMAAYARSLGLLVGVHTNGVYPERIGAMADAGLLDAVFLDVKAPLEPGPYRAACGAPGAWEPVKRSLALCCEFRESGKIRFFEARTTVFHGISDTPGDIVKIARSAECADAYVVQQGRPEVAADEKIRATEAVSRDELMGLARAARDGIKNLKKVIVRTHAFGDEAIDNDETIGYDEIVG